MTVLPYSPLEAIDANIRDALAELRGARACHEYCPDASSLLTIEVCERRLNQLLERRAKMVQ